MDPSHMKALEDHLNQFEQAGSLHGHIFCRQCRVRQLKDEKLMLIQYGLSNLMEPEEAHKVETALHESFKKLKAEVKSGTAPASVASKKLQSDIDNMAKMMGIRK